MLLKHRFQKIDAIGVIFAQSIQRPDAKIAAIPVPIWSDA
jgi:hypothetical protein